MIAPAAILELAGVAVFAISGALVAVRLKQTFLTACFFALSTGVGGGSLRDLLLGIRAEWLGDRLAALVIFGSALAVWMLPRRWWRASIFRINLLEWADAAGMSAFAALGAAKAMEMGVQPVPAIVLGVSTGCVGGIIRDVLAGVPSILMRPELYVTAAALSASICTVALWADLPRLGALLAGSIAGFVLRGAALVWHIELPAYRGGQDDQD